jgi:hypothetical protein
MFIASFLRTPGREEASVELNTSVPELKSLPITARERDCLLAVMKAEEKNFPYERGGVALRYRIELAAAFTAAVISQTSSATEANDLSDPDVFAEVALELTIARAKEIWAQDSG